MSIERRFALIGHTHPPSGTGPWINVADYGADPTGVEDSQPAFAAALATLSAISEGGTVTAPPGDYRLDSAVQVTEGRTTFIFDEYSTFTVNGTYGFHFYGASAAAPESGGGISGGRFICGGATPTACIYIQNFIRLRLEDMFIYGFYTEPDGAGTRCGVKADYTFNSQFNRNYVNRCDYGYSIGMDTGAAYRPTSCSWSGGEVQRCRYGIYARDLWGGNIGEQMCVENNSIGVYLYGDKTTGYNCAAINIAAYFERNGTHLKINSNTSARSIGINIEGSSFESVQANYVSSATPFPDTGGVNKIVISGDRCTLIGNVFSSASSTADVVISSGSTDTVVGWQGRDYAHITDSGTNTVYQPQFPEKNIAETISGAWTVSGNWTFTYNNGETTFDGTGPRVYFNENDQTTDEKLWALRATGKVLSLAALDDAKSVARNGWAATRGTAQALTGIEYGNSVDYPSHTFYGAVTLNGNLTLGTDKAIIFDEYASAPSTPATGTVVLYAKADGLLYSKDDAGTETPLGGTTGSTTLVATLASDQATAANTTPVTLTGLTWTFLPNSVYFFDWRGRVAPTAATTGCGFQLDVSVAVTEISMQFVHQLANTGTLSGGHSIADDASVGVSSGMPGTSTYPVSGWGILRTGANGGTAQLRFSSETTAVTTAKAGMTLVVQKVA